MAVPKKPSKASIAKKRSEAARKGWETRQAKAREEERKAKARLAARRKRDRERKEAEKALAKKREERNQKRREDYARDKALRAAVIPAKKKIKATREKRAKRLTLAEIEAELLAAREAGRTEGRGEGKELGRLDAQAEFLKEILNTWVPGTAPERTRADGTAAIRPSDLRVLENAPELHQRLKRFEKLGQRRLLRESKIIALTYGVSLQEVYTLLMSP